MKRIVSLALAVGALFAGAASSTANATNGHAVDIVIDQSTGTQYEVNPAPGDYTVDGWTWGS